MDLKQWLEANSLGKYAALFAENEIDFDVLPYGSDVAHDTPISTQYDQYGVLFSGPSAPRVVGALPPPARRALGLGQRCAFVHRFAADRRRSP